MVRTAAAFAAHGDTFPVVGCVLHRTERSDTAALHARLAAVYVDLGRMDEAQAAADEAIRLNPKFTASQYMKSYSLHNPARDAWYKDLLVQAGLPE